MKKIITLFILFPLSLITKSQEQFFVKPGRLWSVYHNNFYRPIHPDDPKPFTKTTFYKIDSDTIINNLSYFILLATDDSLKATWSYAGALREHDKKVYFFKGWEYLLYDFDLNTNDTIDLLTSVGRYSINYIVDSIKMYSANPDLNIYYFTTVFGDNEIDHEIWIDGIGSLNGLLRQTTYFFTPRYDIWKLLCLHENDTLTYSNPEFNSCSIYVGADRISNLENDIKVFPNPASNEIQIKSESNAEISAVWLYNSTGSLLISQKDILQNQFRMDVTHLQFGCYFLKVDVSGSAIIKKILIFKH